ncbi:MAG: hypothetical protein AAGH41_05555 [Pseudomonadota bacterium]
MITAQEISNGIAGAFAMAKGRADWPDTFDMSAEQVFKSIWAVLLALPAMLLTLEAQRQIALANPVTEAARLIANMGAMTYYVSQTLVFVLVWAAEIAMLVIIAQRRGAGWKISPLIIGANWAKFVFTLSLGLMTGLSILAGTPGFALFGGMLAYGLLFYLRWGVIRRTMEFSPLRTAGMLAALMLAFIAISTVISVFLALFGFVTIDLPEA